MDLLQKYYKQGHCLSSFLDEPKSEDILHLSQQWDDKALADLPAAHLQILPHFCDLHLAMGPVQSSHHLTFAEYKTNEVTLNE